MTTIKTEEANVSVTRGWLGVGVITLSLFAFVTTELMPVGVLTPVSAGLGITTGLAGLMVTCFGLAAGLGAPVLMSWTSRIDRRHLLSVLLIILVIGNVGTALAPHFGVVLAARLGTGFANGLFWAIGVGTAIRLVPDGHAARATALTLSGISIATVAGIPLGTLLESLTDWRTTFLIWAAVALVASVAAMAVLPAMPSGSATTVREVLRLPADNLPLRNIVVTMVLYVLGHFTIYTYLRPWLEDTSSASPPTVVVLLVVYGVAGAVGNFLAGHLSRGRPRRVYALACSGVVSALLLLALTDASALAAGLVLILWGVSFGAANLCQVNLVLAAAPGAFEAAMSINTLAYNTSIALGALLGGLVVDDLGLSAALATAIALCALSLMVQAVCAPRATHTDGAHVHERLG